MMHREVPYAGRRHFLGASAAALAAPALARLGVVRAAVQPAAAAAAAAAPLVCYQEAEQGGKEHGPTIWVLQDNRPLAVYRAQPMQKQPYFYPLAGPVSGLPLTSEAAMPYPHHRSLWFGCDRVNGMNYWQQGLERGRIVSSGPRVTASGAASATIEDACAWTPPNQPPVLTDRRRFTITSAGPRLWTLDADIAWKAETDVTVERTNHAFFALRAAPDITPEGGGNLVSNEGVKGEKDVFGTQGRWCAFFGRRAGAQGAPVEGIALFDHPENPWPARRWFVRNYGFVSVTPFNWMDRLRLPAGESVRLRYRVAAFAGDPDEARLDEVHRAWVAATAA